MLSTAVHAEWEYWVKDPYYSHIWTLRRDPEVVIAVAEDNSIDFDTWDFEAKQSLPVALPELAEAVEVVRDYLRYREED